MKIPLINKNHPLSPDLKLNLAEQPEGYILEKNTAAHLKRMLCQAAEEGIHLRVFSAYRTLSYQKGLFQSNMDRLITAGYSKEEAFERTRETIALPGESEHNAGVAADITSMDFKGEISVEFENTKEFKWLFENCSRFGFIIRYPKNKQHITGYSYEPWHYRFVGVSAAKTIKNTGLSLEEFFAFQGICV